MKLNYVTIPLMVAVVALLGDGINNAGMYWYQTLHLPSWTPPGGVFVAVWITLYILTALSIILIWNGVHREKRWTFVSFFLLNAFLNLLWSYLFFGIHALGAAVLGAIALEISIIGLIVLAWSRVKTAALLLVPYLVWVGFAIVLACTVWMIN